MLRLKKETKPCSSSIRTLMTMGWHYVVCLCLVCEWWWCFSVFIKPEKSTHSQLNGATVKILYDNKFCVVVVFCFIYGGGNLVEVVCQHTEISFDLAYYIFFMKAINFTSQTEKGSHQQLVNQRFYISTPTHFNFYVRSICLSHLLLRSFIIYSSEHSLTHSSISKILGRSVA